MFVRSSNVSLSLRKTLDNFSSAWAPNRREAQDLSDVARSQAPQIYRYRCGTFPKQGIGVVLLYYAQHGEFRKDMQSGTCFSIVVAAAVLSSYIRVNTEIIRPSLMPVMPWQRLCYESAHERGLTL